MDKLSCRPVFGVVCYAVIALGEEFTHKGSQKNLLGDAPSSEQLQLLSNEKQVSSRTPPCFVWHTAEYTVVPVENSLAFYSSLVKAKVPSELHVFPIGKHGIGLGANVPGANQWPGLCRDWLKRMHIAE